MSAKSARNAQFITLDGTGLADILACMGFDHLCRLGSPIISVGVAVSLAHGHGRGVEFVFTHHRYRTEEWRIGLVHR